MLEELMPEGLTPKGQEPEEPKPEETMPEGPMPEEPWPEEPLPERLQKPSNTPRVYGRGVSCNQVPGPHDGRERDHLDDRVVDGEDQACSCNR